MIDEITGGGTSPGATARGAVAVIGTLGPGNGGPDVWIWTAPPKPS